MGNPIHVALTFDDNFWAPAYATMRSVCYFTRRREDVVFHLIHLGLTDEHRADLEAITRDYGATLKHYDLSQTDLLTRRIADLRQVNVPRFHTITYARLFLFEILPPGLGRVIYLDCDMFVRINIERLYEMELDDKIAAAAYDPYRTAFQTGRMGAKKRYFDPADPYFNAGMVLFAEECAKLDFIAEIKRILTPEELQQIYYDQDVLNLVLAGKWKPLSHRWNLMNPVASDENIDPFIVHYSGEVKPWQIMSKTAFKYRYRHMMTNELFYRFWWHNFWRRWNKRLSRLTFGLWRSA